MRLALSLLLGLFLTITANAQVTQHWFPSTDFFDIDAHIISPVELKIPGQLNLPQGEGPFPAVIVSNSSFGTDDKILDRLLADLPKYGYAAFAIQSFAGRKIYGGIGNRQDAISFHGPALDALNALKYLRTLPQIDPNKICVTGHSRGGAVSFNLTYFNSFLKLAKFEDKPFDCNISINHSGWLRPAALENTGKPAMVFFAELDDMWHHDEAMAWLNEIVDNGMNFRIVKVLNSNHSLSTVQHWAPRTMTPKGCKDQVLYDESGYIFRGKPITAKEFLRECLSYGANANFGNMAKYPFVLSEIVRFLNVHIGTKGQLLEVEFSN